MKRRLLAAAASLAALATPVSAHAADKFIEFPAHKYPAFYVPPSPLPAGQPGEIIRSQRMTFTKSQTKPPKGTRGYLIMYHSRSALGQDIAVTGYVLIPDGYTPKQGVANRPIIGYGNEAEGLGDACAQSSILVHQQSGEVALYEAMLKRGYAVAASDYEGLGTPQVATFGVTMSAAHTTLDMIRAARNLEEAGLPKDGPVGLLGYSQGGSAVLGAEEQQPTYAPDVKLTAVAGGGAPSDPRRFSKFNSGKIFAAVNFGASAGYDAAYPELDLKSFVNERGAVALEHTYTACIESVFTLAFKRSSSFLKTGVDPLSDPRWLKRFAENTIGLLPPKVPTYVYHAVYDQAVPFYSAKELRRRWCAGGTPLKFDAVYILEHTMGGPLWMPVAEKWLGDQIDGKAPPEKGNCGSLAKAPMPAPPSIDPKDY